jgi:hypothetical protein
MEGLLVTDPQEAQYDCEGRKPSVSGIKPEAIAVEVPGSRLCLRDHMLVLLAVRHNPR